MVRILQRIRKPVAHVPADTDSGIGQLSPHSKNSIKKGSRIRDALESLILENQTVSLTGSELLLQGAGEEL